MIEDNISLGISMFNNDPISGKKVESVFNAVKFHCPSRYKIDMDKVNSVKDIELKVNLILSALSLLNITFEEFAVKEEYKAILTKV